MKNFKEEGAIGEKRSGKLNILENRIDSLYIHLVKVTSSIHSKGGRIVDFEPIFCERSEQQIAELKESPTFYESVEEKIQLLETAANELDHIDDHLGKIIS